MQVVEDLDELTRLVYRHQGLFVRFSEGPEADAAQASVDYESGLPLPGLSVNRLDPPRWWTRPLTDWLARQICQYAHLAERAASRTGWILTGKVVGRGPDDEPLLTDVEPVAWLGKDALEQARSWYSEHFHVGHSSA
ncbi:DUF6098 family protein [Actinopolymorpha singaporensis]|uniref:Uncharacterized protein n=1 Tax=Actinopolymorpha singaporensis TaxID=117157 RepID=A0A1H1TJE0_9ACTN|nr:DUF6098 family protein [Actinopolymorpha singaporensis]SDS60312.1 hypothetical protein SAMN04489717_3224 [Actinopolymorpha singaporensis]